MKKTTKSKNNDSLTLIFKKIPVNVLVMSEIYDDVDIVSIKKIVKNVTQEIYIDKTYVAFKGTSFEKVFIKETGWIELCELLEKTDFGKSASLVIQSILYDSYNLLICCYIYQILEDLGYSSEGIFISIDMKKQYNVKIEYDKAMEWKTYVGKWQNWKINKK